MRSVRITLPTGVSSPSIKFLMLRVYFPFCSTRPTVASWLLPSSLIETLIVPIYLVADIVRPTSIIAAVNKIFFILSLIVFSFFR